MEKTIDFSVQRCDLMIISHCLEVALGVHEKRDNTALTKKQQASALGVMKYIARLDTRIQKTLHQWGEISPDEDQLYPDSRSR